MSRQPHSCSKCQPGKRYCHGCREHLPIEAFCKKSGTADGLSYRCRKCYSTYYQANRHDIAHTRRKYVYGINEDDYNTLLREQGGRCAICRTLPDQGRSGRGSRYRLCIDHDHATGKIRGLLCSSCNTGIGLLRHDPQLLETAINYLLSKRS